MNFRPMIIAIVVLAVAALASAAPPTLVYQIPLPQQNELCDAGTFSPIPTGIERLLVGPPAGVDITNTRLVINFVTSNACQPDFNAANLLLILENPAGTRWEVGGDIELDFDGQGTFTASIETNLFNGFNATRAWEDFYYALIETQIPGHFHIDPEVVDSYWEFEYTDPNIVPGDADCDGVITFADLDAFVLGLIDPQGYLDEHFFCTLSLLDVNGDGESDGLDVSDFVVTLLTAPPVGACCLPGGTCEILGEFDCTAAGVDGAYQGNLSTCDSSNCPTSIPQIDFAQFSANPVDNCNGTHFAFNLFGSGFNSDAEVELVKAGQDPVRVNPVGVSDHTFAFAPDFESECILTAGMYDIRLTNPDGGTATLPSALEILACANPPIAVDSIVYSDSVIETCPGTTPTNPTVTLSAVISGFNLPAEFYLQSDFTRTQVHLRSVATGENWYTSFVSDLTQLSPTEFGVSYPIFQGNVFFPHSNPPPGEYQVVVETCAGVFGTEDTIEIRPAAPEDCN